MNIYVNTSADKEIRQRYSLESRNACNLSCGNNLQYLELQCGEKILDVGCGKGSETIQAAVLTGPSGLAVGIDLTEAMIDAAKAAAVKIGVDNAKFYNAIVEKLPFEDGYFDMIISNCAINHSKDKLQAYSEMFRVLKPGGRFVISDAVAKQPLPVEIKNDPEAWVRCFGGAVTEDEYTEVIRAAGFQNINILERREYKKNGYDFASLTIEAYKIRDA